jgi:hypothetical protein
MPCHPYQLLGQASDQGLDQAIYGTRESHGSVS